MWQSSIINCQSATTTSGLREISSSTSDQYMLASFWLLWTTSRIASSPSAEKSRDNRRPAAIIAFQRCNVALAMEIADLFNEDDVHNARSGAAVAAAAVPTPMMCYHSMSRLWERTNVFCCLVILFSFSFLNSIILKFRNICYCRNTQIQLESDICSESHHSH